MGAKVSKAKRPKRRWIGITVPHTIQSRDTLQSTLQVSELAAFKIRLYDFHRADSDTAIYSRNHCQIDDDVGVAVICVLLRDYDMVRAYFTSNVDSGFRSVSSSGKIRLIRERMGLPKPPRT